MNLDERMKAFEKIYTHKLMPRMPVIIRVDGRAFHTYTRNLERPFCKPLISTMIQVARETAGEMSGFKLAYTQSDEASFLLTNYDNFDTEGWFADKIQKLASVTASIFTANFGTTIIPDIVGKQATFDARAFSLPREEVINYFLWRARDWHRNSLSIYARAFFSHKQLVNKNAKDVHEMLHKIGKNWATSLSAAERNGTFITQEHILTDIQPSYEKIKALVETVLTDIDV